MKRFLLLAVLCLLGSPASATNYVIDLSTTYPGNPGTAPLTSQNTFAMTCYCGGGFGQEWSFAAQPGDTFNFGSVTTHPGTFYINGDPGMPGYPPAFLGVFYYPPIVTFSGGPFYQGGPQAGLCGNPCDQLAPQHFELSYVIPAGADQINIGLMTFYSYIPPAVPEPATWLMLLIGFAALAAVSHKRIVGRRSDAVDDVAVDDAPLRAVRPCA